MTTPLHITNGDSMTGSLMRLELKGDIITWREMLCEGKTTIDVGSESFWRQRFEFLHSRYKVSKQNFIDLTLKEYRNLCNHKKQQEIVLWFEDDLFCQVNMLGVLSWLLKQRPYADVFLVSLSKTDTKGALVPLSQLSVDELKECYSNKVLLSTDDMEYADFIWQLYCEKNPIRLYNAVKRERAAFPYLKKAIHAHCKRFPSVQNGLNFLENQMLRIATEERPASREQLIGSILMNQENYGYGDQQYYRMSKRLRPLFKSLNPVLLNSKGMAVLEGDTNFYPVLRNDNDYLGGAPKYSFLYYEENDQLLKL
ncbi:DUF1835 domain-containing protein [Robertkochia marina]|uniref:DUF1835 domain-containing protein n=1 Tax=Robertkochia marina TaxID=1227945 RepID=A0A4S3M0G2_9FLAO|nr:DUF1835 domain-containing protein [Robertkochia marina]THD67902.1 DUF1835 domain-containing protein [Robertkochia marina]TRZ41009.1 DUF1835 domain-containing protein [Robertkochia marina]